jgi:hypothetical protein
MVNTHLAAAEHERAGRRQIEVRRRGWFEFVTERAALLDCGVVQKHVIAVHADAGPRRTPGSGDTAHVIHVRMRQQDQTDGKPERLDPPQQIVYFVARIDEHGVPCAFARYEKPVLVERGNGTGLYDQGHGSILSARRIF